jgi:hypothetical protein
MGRRAEGAAEGLGFPDAIGPSLMFVAELSRIARATLNRTE